VLPELITVTMPLQEISRLSFIVEFTAFVLLDPHANDGRYLFDRR
jgi:hypothetical protein